MVKKVKTILSDLHTDQVQHGQHH